MPELTHIPQGILEPYVKLMWYSNDYSPESSKERVLPQGSSQIIINLGNSIFRHFEGPDYKKERKYDPIILTGISTGYIFLDSFSRISTMGVVLKPGAITALFGIPAGEFRDQIVPVQDICETDTTELKQKLDEAAPPEDKLALLREFLAHCLEPSFQPKPAVIYAAGQLDIKNGMLPIAEILDQTGYSHRWFSKIFKETVGITPKRYSRISRFQHTLRMIRKSSIPDWTSFALSCGYYDQSHFIHDFKHFAGLSPGEYYRNQGDQINHLPM